MESKNLILKSALLLSLGLSACGDDDDSEESSGARDTADLYAYRDGTAAGKIDGKEWQLGTAVLRSLNGVATLTLSDETLTSPCHEWSQGKSATPRKVSFKAKRERGEYRFMADTEAGLVSFSFKNVDDAEFKVWGTDDGNYAIDDVSASQLAGRVYARFNGSTFVNGSFSAVVCD